MSGNHNSGRLLPIATTCVEIEEYFQQFAPTDWRSLAIKQALKELAATLGSVFCPEGFIHSKKSTQALLDCLPALLSESVRVSHADLLAEAAERLRTGQSINLMPLVAAAVQDLRRLQNPAGLQEDEE